jgi:pilus assembly protein Flp/PilA
MRPHAPDKRLKSPHVYSAAQHNFGATPLDQFRAAQVNLEAVSVTRQRLTSGVDHSIKGKAYLMDKLVHYLSDESGASAAEYALILALVAIDIIGGLTILGTTINVVLSTMAGQIQ